MLFSSCREKKDSEVQTLEVTKDDEADHLSALEQENEELRETVSKLKNHYAKYLEFAKKNNIELKPRNVPMGGVYSPISPPPSVDDDKLKWSKSHLLRSEEKVKFFQNLIFVTIGLLVKLDHFSRTEEEGNLFT